MLSLLKRFHSARTTIAGIELTHRIRKGQFKLGKLRVNGKTMPEILNAVLAARAERPERGASSCPLVIFASQFFNLLDRLQPSRSSRRFPGRTAALVRRAGSERPKARLAAALRVLRQRFQDRLGGHARSFYWCFRPVEVSGSPRERKGRRTLQAGVSRRRMPRKWLSAAPRRLQPLL